MSEKQGRGGAPTGASVLLLALLAWPGSVLAQSPLWNLVGSVTDRHHEPLRGAVVVVHNDETNSVTSYLTDRSGQFSFKRLSGDADYSVWATFRGQRSKSKSLSHFDTKPERVVHLVIDPDGE